MKKTLLLLPVILGIFGMMTLMSSSSGYTSDVTGALGTTSGCGGSGCHGTASTSGITISVSLDSAGTTLTSYVPGATYNIKITATNTTSSSLPNFGFELAAVRATGAGSTSATDAGTWGSSLPSGCRNRTVGSRHIIEQSTTLSATSGSGGSGTTYTELIPWTAPASGTGSVKIFGIVNAVNNDGRAAATDKWNLGNATITERATTSSLPAITGPSTVCVGSTITLADSISGGRWSSSTPTVATIDTVGHVTGVRVGTTTITYTYSGSSVYRTITVMGLPDVGTIIGPSAVCTGSSITLRDTTAPGGRWSSVTTSIATVDSTGVVYGVSAGVDTIKYTVTNSCGSRSAVKVITVSTAPVVASITGLSTICVGSLDTLRDSTTGGFWSSSTTSVATIGTSGIARGVGVGTTTISYTVASGGGCYTTRTFTLTVGAAGTAGTITGASSVCRGTHTTLADTVSGGTWTSGNTSIATVTSAGAVYGVTAGTVTISYGVSSSCGTVYATRSMTVMAAPSPVAISGPSTVCLGGSITLVDTSSGGTWSSSASSIATVTSGGIVYGLSVGSATITYSVTNSCGTGITVKNVSVVATPSAGSISGPSSVCGMPTTLVDTISGGTWSSSNTAVATVSSAGIVYPVSTGTVTITYTIATSCGTAYATRVENVSMSYPYGVISGPTSVCVGSSISLRDSTVATSVTWASSSSGIATINPSTGVVTGVSAGTVTITTTEVSTCGTANSFYNVTVIPMPNAGTISGPTSVCTGASITLTDSVGGGTWSISSGSLANISPSGTTCVISGVATGTATISYTVTNTCGTATATTTVTILTTPTVAAITGGSSVCTGTNTTLADGTSGGTWTSSNTSLATVSSSGIVRGVAGGSVTITYTVTNVCGANFATKAMTVIATPTSGVISGSSTVCTSSTTTLSETVSGGTWSSSNTAVATVNSATGVVSGVSAGSVTITYTNSNACGTATATYAMTVIAPPATPSAISGAISICTGTTATFTDATTGGTWSSSNSSVASVSSTGVVSGVSVGTATISYSFTNACGTTAATFNTTVTSTPSAGTITGATSICQGSSTTLADATSGGSWSSSNSSVAAINVGTGVTTGVSAGTVTITYTVTNSCGTARTTASLTVNPLPLAGTITGASTMCPGNTQTLLDTVSGGTWSSSNTAIATVSSTGVVTAVATGSVTISYSKSNACGTTRATFAITVGGAPSAGTVSGASTLCVGGSTTLTDTVSGGLWSSSNTAILTVTSSGVVTAVSTGTASISYTVTNACGSTTAAKLITVGALPTSGTISGPTGACVGTTINLSETVTGGTWVSSSSSIATVSTSGVVTGVSAGSAVISYVVSTSCATSIATYPITVSSSASAGTITGLATVCLSASITLTDAVTGGTWSSSNPSVASVSATGIVFGVTTGTATISYSVSGSCGAVVATKNITVNSTPTVSASTGASSVCVGTTTTLTNSTSGGAWISSNTAVATVSSAGVVRGVAVGTVNITYYVTTACGTATTVKTMTVTTLSAGLISGPVTVAVGNVISLSSSITGGTWASVSTATATVTSAGVVTGVTPGIDTITYTVTNACGSATARKAINVTATRTALTSTVEGINVFPNPTSGLVTIELPAGATNASLIIADMSGKASEIRDITDNKSNVDLSGYAPGTYIINVNVDGKVYSQRVVIQ